MPVSSVSWTHDMDLVFPDGIKIGYEIEFCSARSHLSDAFAPLRTWFDVEPDNSLDPIPDKTDTTKFSHGVHCVEIKSKVPLSVVSVDVLAMALDHVNSDPIHAFTTRRCGLHFHISSTSADSAMWLWHKVWQLTRKVETSIFMERVNYCAPRMNSSRGPRYNCMRWVDIREGHFEVRIFNGTTRLRGVLHWLKRIHSICTTTQT